MPSQDIAARIQKLLALAEDPAASANEKAIAQRKAEALMLEHSLSAHDVERAEYVVRELEHPTYSQFPGWYKQIGAGLGDFLGVVPLYRSGTGQSRNALFVVGGRPSDLEMFAYLIESIRHQVQHLATAYRTANSASRAETHAYRVGVATRVRERLRAIVSGVTRRQQHTAASPTTLTLAETTRRKRRHAEAILRTRYTIRSGRRTTYRSDAAFASGHRDGDRVTVRNATEAGREPRRLSD